MLCEEYLSDIRLSHLKTWHKAILMVFYQKIPLTSITSDNHQLISLWRHLRVVKMWRSYHLQRGGSLNSDPMTEVRCFHCIFSKWLATKPQSEWSYSSEAQNHSHLRVIMKRIKYITFWFNVVIVAAVKRLWRHIDCQCS